MMDLRLQRIAVSDHATEGDLFVDGMPECFTLERAPLDPFYKPIPAGRYPVTIYFSPRADRYVLLLHDVPGRTAIEMHPANWPQELKGCIAPGRTRARGAVYDSKIALDTLLAKIVQVEGEVYLTVEDPKAVTV